MISQEMSSTHLGNAAIKKDENGNPKVKMN